ncbi:MAG: UxaA family hydrolase [Steroidobacteraceae bacterium]
MSRELLPLTAIGRIPIAGDNAAIAIRDLEAGTCVGHEGRTFVLSHSMLEGHRFAVRPIGAGDWLLSWNQPFGRALRAIQPGEYLCNAGVLDALRIRHLPFPLPQAANFQNATAEVKLVDLADRCGRQVEARADPRTFLGYSREGRSGGTRNYLVALGTTSSTASFVRLLAASLEAEVRAHPGIDGIVAIAHTEGSGPIAQNNRDIILRTLAGMLVNPNVAAVLAVDLGHEQLNNTDLEAYARTHGYPLDQVPHRFHSLGPDLDRSMSECREAFRGWFAAAGAARRVALPLQHLRIGLQCGGSDAFSGISANPLAGWMSKELIRHGGSANLAETDELIGAENYVLANVRDVATARAFLDRLRVFSERIAWHGHSAEGNPTGGNKFRGLYNISLKSIGAARKKDPEVRLDHVIDYAQPMREPGFYFMDSPGNDLESISGQVGAGCNLIVFTTGNGSITNHPLVPTIKLMTTTRRFELLSADMDFNAGRYLDGESMEQLGGEAFEYLVSIASGRRSAGERAGHSQVSLWRNWQQSDASQLPRLGHLARPTGEPIALTGIEARRPTVRERLPRVGLIVPTSLCAGQIALRIADMMNREVGGGTGNVRRYVALAHTEGCGASGGENEEHLLRTMIGYLRHPMVGPALLLEHGCERTHNDLMRHALQHQGLDPALFGYASIQLDGGIDKVVAKVCDWFRHRPAATAESAMPPLCIGLAGCATMNDPLARALGLLVVQVVASGGSLIIPRGAGMLGHAAFLTTLGRCDLGRDTLEYGQPAARAGLHIMATPSQHDVEVLTGLGATGASAILLIVEDGARQANPLVPTVQVGVADTAGKMATSDLDLLIEPDADAGHTRDRLLGLMLAAARDEYHPRAAARGLQNFQLTRGYLGVSL